MTETLVRTAEPKVTKFRIETIDVLRGVAMLIMALDHVRDYFYFDSNVHDPLDLATTTPLLFFTRWITHFCAPVFVFLSGISVFLQGIRKEKKELSAFLIKRGLWLILIEVTVVTFAWSFNPFYNFIFLQVIWAIGISMVILGVLIWFPFNLILITGLAIVLGHNLLDPAEANPGFRHSFINDLLHSGRFSPHEWIRNHFLLVVYPFIPWTGVMMLGYCAGKWYQSSFPQKKRKMLLLAAGFGLLAVFITVRYLNIYGDPDRWNEQKNSLFTFLSFMKVTKYPPSLLYLCVTIGPALIFLALTEHIKNRLTQIVKVYGRVAFFYYIIHIYLIHFLSASAFLLRGHSLSDATHTGAIFPFYFVEPGEGYGLLTVYMIWIAVIAALYPLCRWYDRYKSVNSNKWWLSYI